MLKRLDSAHFRQVHIFHQSLHSADADIYAIITLKTNLNFISTKTLFRFCIKFKNTFTYMPVFFFTIAVLVIYVFVISASVNVENTAKCCDSMFAG